MGGDWGSGRLLAHKGRIVMCRGRNTFVGGPTPIFAETLRGDGLRVRQPMGRKSEMLFSTNTGVFLLRVIIKTDNIITKRGKRLLPHH